MATETSKKFYNKYIVPIITMVIGGIIVAIMTSFFKINPLENEIQIKNTMIQKIENNITLLKDTIQQQNIQIKNLRQQILEITGDNNIIIGDGNKIDSSFNKGKQ